MSAISLKSITGITSITTPAGVDNQLTLHTNNTTERLKIDEAGNVRVANTFDCVGVSTFRNNLFAQADLRIAGEIVHISDADTRIQFPSNDTIAFKTANSERLRITSSGNIGAGTNNPDGFYTHAKNLVIGSGSSGEGITIFSGSSDSGYIGFNDTVSNGMQGFIQYNHNGDYMAFGPNGTEKVRITSAGLVGIGVANPSEILHIKKNDTIGPTITLENNANKAYINNWGSNGGGGGRANRFEINATSQAQASICAPYITFMTGGTGDSNEKIRITSDGKLLVGATAATNGSIAEFSKSVAGGGAGCHITVENTSNNSVNNTAGIHLRTATGTAKFFKYQAAQTYLQSASGGASELLLQANGAHPMRLYTNGNERLQIASDGRVQIAGQNAIATTSLTHRLLVRSQNDSHAIAIAGRNGDHIGELTFYQSDASTRLGEIQAHTTHLEMTSRVGYLSLQAGGPTERVRIASSGFVGINETSPDSRLHVNSGSTNDVATFESTDAYAHIYIKDSGTHATGTYFGVQGNDFRWITHNDTSSAERLRLTKMGNIQHVDGSGVSYFKGASEYIIGSQYSSPPAGGAEAKFQIHDYKTRAQFSINGYMNNAGGPFMQFVSSRSGTPGVLGTKAALNDYHGDIRFMGDNGTNYQTLVQSASIMARQKSTISDGDTVCEGELQFYTGNTTAGAVQQKLQITGSGKIKYGLHDSSMPHAVQARGFVIYPNNGGNNKTTIRVSGLVSGCFIFQMGYYNSSGQGEGGFACAVSGYMTSTNQYTIDNIKAPYAHANSSISGINKQNSYFEFTITNNHGSYTGGGTIGIIGDQEMTITVTYHS